MRRRHFTAFALTCTGTGAMSQTPADQNRALADLAHLFFEDNGFVGHRYLDRQRLDFSLESLDHVNKYLERMRATPDARTQWNRLILRTGAYVGEVIRKNDKRISWRWLDYSGAKSVETFGKSIGTAAVLNDGKDGFVFPLAKVEKYLENGSEDNVHAFARVILTLQR